MAQASACGVLARAIIYLTNHEKFRLALQEQSLVKIGDEGKAVEVDETFIGGAARHMHKAKRAIRITSTGMKDKTPVAESWSAAEKSALR